MTYGAVQTGECTDKPSPQATTLHSRYRRTRTMPPTCHRRDDHPHQNPRRAVVAEGGERGVQRPRRVVRAGVVAVVECAGEP